MTRLNQFLIYDELPLWSAPFGLALLDTVRVRRNIHILDIGSGGGFPMLEIAERFGASCKVSGVDPSEDAVEMIGEKIRLKGIANAEIVKAEAEKLPFSSGFFHLVVANNGLNNVKDERLVLSECFRVSAKDAQLVLTMNLPHTFVEFYEILEEILAELGMKVEIRKMQEHIAAKRKPVEWWKERIEESGFSIATINVDGFKMRFTGGSAFLSHYLIRIAFMPPWKSFMPAGRTDEIFSALEKRLNARADSAGVLDMSVPFVCFDCRK